MFILNGALVALDRLSGSRPGSLWPDNQHRRAPYPHALRVIARAPPSPCRAHSLQRTPLTVRLVFWQAGSFQDHLPQRAVRIDARAATQACPYAPRLRAVCSSAHELPACPHTNSCNNIACRVHRRARWWEGEQGEQEGVVPDVRRRQPAEYRLCERRRQPAAARAPASHATALHVPACTYRHHLPPSRARCPHMRATLMPPAPNAGPHPAHPLHAAPVCPRLTHPPRTRPHAPHGTRAPIARPLRAPRPASTHTPRAPRRRRHSSAAGGSRVLVVVVVRV